MINWNKIKKEDSQVISKIANRAVETFGGDKLDFVMDLEAAHTHGCPLNLDKLLNFDRLNFAHDIFGINRHLDRDTGELKDCFLPRCAL